MFSSFLRALILRTLYSTGITGTRYSRVLQYCLSVRTGTAGYIIQRPGLEIVYVWYIKIFCTVCAILTCLTGTTQFPHFFE
jgi:hypothetical protein